RMARVNFAGAGATMSSLSEGQIAQVAMKDRTSALEQNLAKGTLFNPPVWSPMQTKKIGARTLYSTTYGATSKSNPADIRKGYLWMILAPPLDASNQTVYIVIYEEGRHEKFSTDPIADARNIAATLQIVEEPKPKTISK
ncbi:MAG: hypothetical protein ACREJQ_03605, partial [bacterium]